ncbi:FAD-dependent monooxygenase [uncultured Aeromicrobium sp.]|uniref:FAD-dependent monooxygenase n=1 Tax=uncultured Aeromicrobium sp. TaxID=337820 RepID=UPI0025D9F9D8|nr:FAD-dependent monooxygenase [uncultured Aeromicrobium sp.]
MSIGIDLGLLSRVTGAPTWDIPTIEVGFNAPMTLWRLVYGRLSDTMQRERLITVHRGITVTGIQVSPGGRASVHTDADECTADLVLGADGHRSTVRGHIEPRRPHAEYSGYILWRGLIEESTLRTPLSARDARVGWHEHGGQLLVTFAIPSTEADIRSGHRLGSFTWFDARHNAHLRMNGILQGRTVVHSLYGPDLDDRVLRTLLDSSIRWPNPWRDAIGDTLASRQFIGTPVTEYSPTRLSRGPVAMIGDAAHAVSPVTGAGFHHALLDIDALVRALADVPDDIPRALAQYERSRLQLVQRLVRQSREAGRPHATHD